MNPIKVKNLLLIEQVLDKEKFFCNIERAKLRIYICPNKNEPEELKYIEKLLELCQIGYLAFENCAEVSIKIRKDYLENTGLFIKLENYQSSKLGKYRDNEDNKYTKKELEDKLLDSCFSNRNRSNIRREICSEYDLSGVNGREGRALYG